MHLAAHLYWRIVDNYLGKYFGLVCQLFRMPFLFFSLGNCPRVNIEGGLKGNVSPVQMATAYSRKYKLDISGGHNADYNQADRDLIMNNSPISGIDLFELL